MRIAIASALAAATLLIVTPAFAGNTSSNSSSNTSSDSGSRGSSYRHSHQWSVDRDDGRGRRVVRGSTYIERERYDRPRRYRIERDDDD